MRKTFLYPVYFLLATFLISIVSCNTNNSIHPDVEDLCQPAQFFDMGAKRWTIDYLPYFEKGTNINFDSDLGLLAIGEHSGATEGPDDEKIGGITLFFDSPKNQYPGTNTEPRCISIINSIIMTTTDARVGTSAEINPKTYQFALEGVTEDCVLEVVQVPQVRTLPAGRRIEFLYISQNRAHGWFCLPVQQVTPETGDPFSLIGFFVARNQ